MNPTFPCKPPPHSNLPAYPSLGALALGYAGFNDGSSGLEIQSTTAHYLEGYGRGRKHYRSSGRSRIRPRDLAR